MSSGTELKPEVLAKTQDVFALLDELARLDDHREGLIVHQSRPRRTSDGRELQAPLRYEMGYSLRKRRGYSAQARKLALAFINFIERYRECNRPFEDDFLAGGGSHTDEPFLPGALRFQPDKDWIKRARKLAPFSVKNYKQWADLGWRMLEAISLGGKVENNPALHTPEHGICNVRRKRHDPYVGIKSLKAKKVVREYDCIAKADIKDAFYLAMKQIATGEGRR